MATVVKIDVQSWPIYSFSGWTLCIIKFEAIVPNFLGYDLLSASLLFCLLWQWSQSRRGLSSSFSAQLSRLQLYLLVLLPLLLNQL